MTPPPTTPAFQVRRATVTDAAAVARHRVGMFRDMGRIPSDAAAAVLEATTRAVIEALLRDGSYLGWVAVTPAGDVIAGAGVHIKPQLPRPSLAGPGVESGPVPLVVNVFTEHVWRRRGVATALMRAIQAWATAERYDRVLLHASPDGRPLYEMLGFQQTNEMRWDPPAGPEPSPAR